MLFEIDEIKKDYAQSKWKYRELSKWAFSLGTLGLGGLYLWLTTKVIAEGQIGLRQSAYGKFVLLPPGRHSFFPWESSWKPQWLSNKSIEMGPYKIITVETGEVAETYNKGKLEILKAGQHLILEASHTVKSIIKVKQVTKKLKEVVAATSDNIGLTIFSDVRYQITEPELALAEIQDLETSIMEIAGINIALIVSHHSLADFAPVTSGTTSGAMKSESESSFIRVLAELTDTIKSQLEELGIKLINIGITSWKINDETLARELGEGAVIKSQTFSKLAAAQNAAEVRAIEVKAECSAISNLAETQSSAIRSKGLAFKDLADEFSGNAAAEKMYNLSQQSEMVATAKNCNLFFSPPQSERAGSIPPVILTEQVNACKVDPQ